ncbi:Snf7-domain-containing protein [Sistotremastrum niveocremeum HHB9708]|uniref:Vacuolar-sorting protein SNF7 n=2 Tax=Sistotremastraceae TaxID=3402574 RepID=A0A164ZSY5_9AGAM|nr:Snf7-domain-containing protein [Sistotremastrum niveocremeum HHB9708]KZT38359.1 Snf7-domain-containing protein [Sistotremastrum suecicum HHB10207 ss-3]
MMAGIMSYFGGRRDTKQGARDAIVQLRQQLQMLEKKEDHLQKKIDEEVKKAKANAVSNKAVATAALRRKKAHEQELTRLSGTRLQLEMQVNTLESANLNAETMAAMKRGADALKAIHGNLSMNKVDATMDQINEQRELANEISEAISNPLNAGIDLDEDELKDELAELEREELDERLMGAERAPVHSPSGATKVAEPRHRNEEEDEEEAQLKELQASLAM